jgi:hypothetical protein
VSSVVTVPSTVTVPSIWSSPVVLPISYANSIPST